MATDSNTLNEDRIGGYRIVRVIHPGATSVVMEVVQDGTEKRFALKQLLASRGEDSDERKAFAHEAKIGQELRHPNLVRVHEYHRDPVQPWFTMDFFAGYHLKLPIARPSVYPMPKAQLHRIIEQAAAGLAYMHDKGWTHRDVKPENLIASKSGEVKVIDYALAMKPIGGLRKLFGGKVPRQGTPSYISPEQIRCESPAPSADIYSFGITCYELACGRPPFRANSLQELLNKHLQERPLPLGTHNKLVTQEYNDLVLKMLMKKPADRLPSLHDFLTRFRSVRIFQDDPAPGSGGNGPY
ncbi:serine/threonine protein kinase [Aquisphaera insulae]|uniref:serine/threonine protein kinase n=1 Tax=Aquisphaera insulae TaxID=2712864 RepID=UPI0013ECD1F0|nr:serine/threonine-protein kinase [Aquisphaera insulae]